MIFRNVINKITFNSVKLFDDKYHKNFIFETILEK